MDRTFLKEAAAPMEMVYSAAIASPGRPFSSTSLRARRDGPATDLGQKTWASQGTAPICNERACGG